MRLYQLFYVTALIATAVNLLGLLGIAVGCGIAGAWYYVFLGEGQRRRRNALEVIVAATILFLITSCLLPSVSMPRCAGRLMQCQYGVKNVALALLNYESVWKSLPPAITYDADGRPTHSWRVLILPYLEEEKLYQKYSFNEPWNGPRNSKLLSQMPPVYRCPFLREKPDTEFKTGYRVLIGERTSFPPDGSRKLSEIRDGMANTLLLVESNQPVPWMEPSDPYVSDYFHEMQGWTEDTPHHSTTLLSHSDFGGIFSFVDGSTFRSNAVSDKRVLEKLAYVDDGALTASELETVHDDYLVSHPRWEGYLALIAFFILAILPAFWLFSQDKHPVSTESDAL